MFSWTTVQFIRCRKCNLSWAGYICTEYEEEGVKMGVSDSKKWLVVSRPQ